MFRDVVLRIAEILLAVPDTGSRALSELLRVLAQQAAGFNVGGALVIGAVEEAEDADENGLWRAGGIPPFRGIFVSMRVVTGRVKDRYAELAVGVDVGMERNRLEEGHRRRRSWKVLGEGHAGAEKATYFIESVSL